MKRSDSILQNYYMDKLPKYQEPPGTVLPGYAQQYLTGRTGDLRGLAIDSRFSQNIAAAKERDRQALIRATQPKPSFIQPAAARTPEHEAYRRRKLAEIEAINPNYDLDAQGELVKSGYARFMDKYGRNLDKFAGSLETPLAIEGALSMKPLFAKALGFTRKITSPRVLISEFPVQRTGSGRSIQTIKKMPTWRESVEAVSGKNNPDFNADLYANSAQGLGVKYARLTSELEPKLIDPDAFKSEINWGAWNPDTPKYPELINEYNAIEEATKKAGTWMKNSDGSPFRGTPEQFIQQQSSYFKKAFPKGFEKTYRGGNNDPLLNREHPIVFTGDYNTALQYTGIPSQAQVATPQNKAGRALFDLYLPKNDNAIVINNQGRSWREIPRRYFGDNPPEHDSYRFPDISEGYTSTDDIAKWMVKNDKEYVKINKIFDSVDADHVTIVNQKPGNYLKSAVGNVGFFDMTNPNIYKGFVPAAILTGTTAFQSEKKQGGPIINQRGFMDGVPPQGSNWRIMGDGQGTSITMDLPNMPDEILVVPDGDFGQAKVMKQGEEEYFMGADFVDEYLQDGGSMKYYQEGLDFKPKTISQNGSAITTDINDYRRWQDSATLYNQSKAVQDYYRSKGYRVKPSSSAPPSNYIQIANQEMSDLARRFNETFRNFKDDPGEKNIPFLIDPSGNTYYRGASSNFIERAVTDNAFWGKEPYKKEFLRMYNKLKTVPKGYTGTLDMFNSAFMDTGVPVQYLHPSIRPTVTLSVEGTGPRKGNYDEIFTYDLNAIRPRRQKVEYTPDKPLQPIPSSKKQTSKTIGPFPIIETPRRGKYVPIPREAIDLGYELPTPKSFVVPKAPEQTPTKYTFTYPTGKYNEQKTMYFPSKAALKSFVGGIRDATYQEGKDYASATGTLQDGGDIPVAQKGKRVPIVVSDPKDPRLKAYQDSLNLYNLNRNYINAVNKHVLIGTKALKTPNLTQEQYSNLIIPSLAKAHSAVDKFVRYKRISNVPNKPSESVEWLRHAGDVGNYNIIKTQTTAHKKPVQPVVYKKPEPKQEVVKKPEPVVEKKAPLTDYFQGTPVYAPTPYHGSGAGAFVGYRTPQGDTVFVKPEDYERMGVPKYGREFIESQTKKQRNGGQHGGLDRWFAEKWVDVKTGKPCGRQEGENRAYPACRPSKRVSSKTPKTSSELSSAEKEKFKRSKTSSERIPYSHKRRK